MDQSDLIAQFCAITAAEPSLAESYLAVADNNLESAITLFLESGGASVESQQRAVANPAILDSDDDEDSRQFAERIQQQEYAEPAAPVDNVRERIQPVTERLVDPVFEPFTRRSTPGLSRAPVGVFNQHTPDSQILDDDDIDSDVLLEQTIGTSRVSRHANRLANLFRPPFDIITPVDLDTAKADAMESKKWILVNIQESSEFACQVLNRDVWSNKDIKQTVRDNFVFLQYASDSEDGQEYAGYYPFQAYPHVSILDPRTGEQLRVWSEIASAQQFLEELRDFLATFSLDRGHQNPLAKIPKDKNVDHMTEEEQIELAMRRSLGNQPVASSDDEDFMSIHSRDEDDSEFDNDVKVIKTVTKSDKPAVSTDSMEISDSEDDNAELTEEDIFASILPEDLPEPPNDASSTRIQLRLSTGARIIRRFALSDPVRNIFAYAKHSIPAVEGHHFALSSERRNLLELRDETIDTAKLQNSVVLVEILD